MVDSYFLNAQTGGSKTQVVRRTVHERVQVSLCHRTGVISHLKQPADIHSSRCRRRYRTMIENPVSLRIYCSQLQRNGYPYWDWSLEDVARELVYNAVTLMRLAESLQDIVQECFCHGSCATDSSWSR